MNRYIFAPLILLIILFSTGFITHGKLKITGVWKIVEVQTVRNGNTVASIHPTESQAFFYRNYYSFCWTIHSTPLRSWNLPDTVKLSRFNQSIVNTGSFELKDSILITKAVFAMHPMFVNGEARFKCSFAGDTLILTGTSVMSSENIPNPVYADGSYFVTKLIKTENLK
ncbi:MAG: hypothetical protein JSS98_04035 [Bacteroidetes bacterium]|nr:hypothetical protein [Bacteroidota bacterium]